MFNKNSNNIARNEAEFSSINLIGAGTVIKGDIHAEGDIRIDGILAGSLTAKGKVVVGSTGKIEGEVICQNADISGTLKARITVAELLSLKSTAKLLGEIVTGKLSIEPGANFSGKCSMGAVIKEMKHEEKQQQKQQRQLAHAE